MIEEILEKFKQAMGELGFIYGLHYSPVVDSKTKRWRFTWRALKPTNEQRLVALACFRSHFAGHM